MVEAVVFLSAIMGLLLSVSVFLFHVLTRKSDMEDDIDAVTNAIDKAANEAVLEVNRTSQLALEELNDKLNEMNRQHQALLFLYQLMDDKKKDIDSLPNLPKDAAFLEELAKAMGTISTVTEESALELAGVGDTVKVADDEVSSTKQLLQTHPRYAQITQIKEMQMQGLSVAEIARQLDMGQGEISFLINLGGR